MLKKRSNFFVMYQFILYQRLQVKVVNYFLLLAISDHNDQDCYAVAVMYEDRIVGHVPLTISKCISFFLNRMVLRN